MGVLTEDKSVDISSTLFDLHTYMNLVKMIMILDCNSTSPVEVDLGTDERVSTPQKAGRSVSPTHLTFTCRSVVRIL